MCFGTHDFLEVDEELRLLIPKRTKEERDQLEANILADGEIRDPIIVWDRIVIDGMGRFEIARKHKMPFHIKRKEFNNNAECKAWMYRNQLGRRNLTENAIRLMRGDLYNLTKDERGGDRKSKRTDCALIAEEPTAQQLAKSFGTGARTIQQDGKLAESVKQMPEEVAHAVVNHEVKADRKDIEELAAKPAAEQKKIVRKVKSGKAKSVKEALHPKEVDESLPEHLRELAADKTLADYVKSLTATVKDIKRIGNEIGGRFLVTAEIVDHLNQARNLIANGIFHCVCPRCNGKKSGCHHCRKSGWLPEWALEEMESVA